MLRDDNDHAQLDWSASSSSNPIRWRPRADHGQKSEPAKGQRKKGLTNRGPLQKSMFRSFVRIACMPEVVDGLAGAKSWNK